VLKIVREKSLGGQGSAPNPAGELTALSQTLAGGACCSLPKNPTPRCRPTTSIFGPSGLIRQPLPTVFISPMRKGLDKKTLVVPIFGAKECIRMQNFLLKNIQKNSWGRDPRAPAAGGETFFAPTHPYPPARCW